MTLKSRNTTIARSGTITIDVGNVTGISCVVVVVSPVVSILSGFEDIIGAITSVVTVVSTGMFYWSMKVLMMSAMKQKFV